MSTTVTPSLAARTCSRYSHRSLRARGSSPVLGSSSSSTAAGAAALGQLDAPPQAAGERFDAVAGAVGQAEVARASRLPLGEHRGRCSPYRWPWQRRFSATVSLRSRLGA